LEKNGVFRPEKRKKYFKNLAKIVHFLYLCSQINRKLTKI